MSVATSSVQTVKRFPTPNGISTPTAYATYWNGAVAACGGTSSYAGSYTFQTAMSCSNFGAVSNASLVFSEPATIDSTGAITDDGTYRVWGSISSGGTGSFTAHVRDHHRVLHLHDRQRDPAGKREVGDRGHHLAVHHATAAR